MYMFKRCMYESYQNINNNNINFVYFLATFMEPLFSFLYFLEFFGQSLNYAFQTESGIFFSSAVPVIGGWTVMSCAGEFKSTCFLH